MSKRKETAPKVEGFLQYAIEANGATNNAQIDISHRSLA